MLDAIPPHQQLRRLVDIVRDASRYLAVRQGIADKNAAALSAHDITISNQLLVNGNHGIARYIELLRQLARRRQARIGRKGAIGDSIHQF